MNLTAKQQRFVEEYLIDLNATQAAKRAGYSKKTANEQGNRLLSNVSVKKAVQVAKVERSQRTAISADTVLNELLQVLDVAMARSVTLIPAKDQNGNSISLGIKKHDLANALKALDLIGKHIDLNALDKAINDQKSIMPKITIILDQELNEKNRVVH